MCMTYPTIFNLFYSPFLKLSVLRFAVLPAFPSWRGSPQKFGLVWLWVYLSEDPLLPSWKVCTDSMDNWTGHTTVVCIDIWLESQWRRDRGVLVVGFPYSFWASAATQVITLKCSHTLCLPGQGITVVHCLAKELRIRRDIKVLNCGTQTNFSAIASVPPCFSCLEPL